MAENSLLVASMLAQPVGSSSEETVEFEGHPVAIALTNLDDSVEIKASGSLPSPEVCGRCGRDYEEMVELDGNYEAAAEPKDDTVYPIDRSGHVDIQAIIREELELKRPLVPHCPDCESQKPTKIVIE